MVAAAIVVIVAAGYLTRPNQNSESTKASKTKPTISIPTTDGLMLTAELSLPKGTNQVPAVILIHSFAKDHHEWDPYVKDFTDHGYAVLAYDTRGFGESKLPSIPTDFMTWDNAMPTDVTAVVQYLKTQSRIDARRINVIGAELGANVAYVASGSNLGIHRTVLLTPHQTGEALNGKNISNFTPTNNFGVSDINGSADLDPFMAYVPEPKDKYVTETPATGVKLLSVTSVNTRVMAWLSQ